MPQTSAFHSAMAPLLSVHLHIHRTDAGKLVNTHVPAEMSDVSFVNSAGSVSWDDAFALRAHERTG